MKLKKIEMFGFKSFADKLEISFEDGVTGIVGPNGCGKSNVADAVRWVLGEQSAKALRGQNMQDVIFNGTERRKSQSFCEVSLFFDNHSKIFPVEYEEIIITRKLYRSGESLYLINRNVCKLKDIVELFRDSGLGKESYSIIGQGKVEEILSAKPENRRAIFEEAAGISKFKNRKLEAERKLERTRDNLARVNDIVHELELQLEPLRRQSENAKKYLELKEQLKILEVNTYIYQYDSASENKAKINVVIAGIDEELEQKRKDFDLSLERYNKSLESINNLDKDIEHMRDELLSLTVAMEKQAGESKLLTERNQNLKENTDKLIEEEKSLGEKKVELEEQSKDALNKREYLAKVIEELKQKVEKTTQQYLELVDKITACEHEVEVSGHQEIMALDKLTNLKADISGLDAKQEAIKTKLVENAERQKIVDDKLDQYASELKDNEIKFKSAENENKEIKLLQSKTLTENSALVMIQNELKQETEKLNAEYHASLSKLNLLTEMQKVNEGYIYSVRKILNDSKTNASIAGLAVGVVASLMKVPEKYETAIEMALGGAVQNIVTKDEQDAKKLIEYLKQNKSGRATFLPMTSVKDKYLAREYLDKIKIKGCYGVASDLIAYEPKYDSVFKGLLGTTVVVENTDIAIELAKQTKYGFKIVSLDGDIINPFGSISGGSKKTEGLNLIGREREIEKLKKQIEEYSAKLQQNNSKISEKTAKIEKNVQEIKENSEALIALEMTIASCKQKQNELEILILDFTNEKQMLRSQEAELNQKYLENEKALSQQVGLESVVTTSRTTAISNKQTKSGEYERLKQSRNEINEQLNELKIKLASSEAEKFANESDIVRLNKELGAIEFVIRQNKLDQQRNLTDIAQNERLIESNIDKEALEKNKGRLAEIKEQLSSLDQKKDDFQQQMQKADADKMILSSELQALAEKRNKQEILLTKVDIDIETMQERVWEEYALTYALAQNYKQADYNLEKGLSETSKIKKSISALGDINVNSIEQLKDVDERYQDLFSQKTDLQSAEEDLVKIIEELTLQMEERFVTQFNLINENFKKIFAELFNGGRAELRLEENVSMLEAGIEIVAEPSGKKLQNIMLLSGGEKSLTAIAILFAILKLRPMPFCVLDEIEAALDDANTERFARYLKKFSADTQFIVITHKKPTMELADSLYGVTMEEKGVSKMVSVKLSDAIKNAGEAV